MAAWWTQQYDMPWLTDQPARAGAFAHRIDPTLLPGRDGFDSPEVTLADLRGRAEQANCITALDAVLSDDRVAALLEHVFLGSPFLRTLSLRDPQRLVDLLTEGPEAAFRRALVALKDGIAAEPEFDTAMTLLRRFKADVAILTGLADLGGLWPLLTVTRAVTYAADVVISESLKLLFSRAVAKGDWVPRDEGVSADNLVTGSGLFVLGMGKYGAGELNYSSDIDLIVFFDETKAALKDGLSPQQFYVRLVRDLVRLIQEQTPDGYVFRVDLRLRPDPGSTQVAISYDAALIYYENYGQNWERAAFIKARPVAGDLATGQQFLRELDPYVWRKYLDYAAVADVHAMKRQIHAFKGFGDVAVAGHDVKLGPGGIREIEFFVQTQQLIAGGRQPELRDSRTLVSLATLAERDWITTEARDALHAAYVYLRTVEHRLQMVADGQTHTIPSDDAGLRAIAHFCGFTTVADFVARTQDVLKTVQGHYGALFEDVPTLGGDEGNLVFAGEADDPGTVTTLSELGFEQPSVVLSTMRGWHHGRYKATVSERARESLTDFQPVLIEALAKTGSPDQAFLAFDRFLRDLPAGVQLFSLLRNNPNLLRLVADVMGTAPRLATRLGRRSRTLEAVLDPGFFGHLPEASDLEGILDVALGEVTDFGDFLDQARVVGNEQLFLVGVRVLSGILTADQAGVAYGRLANALIGRTLAMVQMELERAHGQVTGGAAVVVGMGKLGGFEMTASSDLDLILIYDFDDDANASDGKRPLMASQYFSRMTQRLVTSLSSSTAEGELYEVDMRLRPSGNSGPVATRLSSFSDYQKEQAWTWEHMALLRARCVAGPDVLRSRVDAAIRETLLLKRNRASIVHDVLDMRTRLERERGTEQPWDIKLVRGGQVDIEFIVQFLQLIHAHEHPDVLERNTGLAVERLAEHGLLSEAHAASLRDAVGFYNALMQVLRLCVDGAFEPETAPDGLRVLLRQSVGEPTFDRLEARLLATQGRIRTNYSEIIC